MYNPKFNTLHTWKPVTCVFQFFSFSHCSDDNFSPEAELWAAKRDLLSDLAPWAIKRWSFRDHFPLVCVECVGQCWTPWWIQGLQWCWLHMETALPRGIMRNALVPQLVSGSWHNCSSSNAALKALITRWANSWYYFFILFQDIIGIHFTDFLFWGTEKDLPFISDYKAAVLQPFRECLSDPIPETPFWDSGVICVISWMWGMQQYTLHDNETQISRKSKMTTSWDVWVTHLRQISLSILWSMVVVFGWTNCPALATGLLQISQFFGPCASSWKSQSIRCPNDFCWKNRISGMKGGVISDTWRGCVLS